MIFKLRNECIIDMIVKPRNQYRTLLTILVPSLISTRLNESRNSRRTITKKIPQKYKMIKNNIAVGVKLNFFCRIIIAALN